MAPLDTERELVRLFPEQCRIYGMEGCAYVAEQSIWLAEQVDEGRIDIDEAHSRAEAAARKIAGCLGQQRIDTHGGGIFCARKQGQRS